MASASPTVCTATGGEVSLLAAGTCTLVAAQPGYLEAQLSFTVERTPQQVGFSSFAPTGALAGGPPYEPAAQASSGLPVTLVSLTPAVCAVEGGAVVPLAAGICTISAEQAGDGEYEPAQAVTQSYSVAAVPVPAPAPSGGTLSFHQETTPFVPAPKLRVLSARAASSRSGAITLTLSVSPGGTLRWSATFSRATRCRGGRCTLQLIRYAAGRETVGAGQVVLTLHPSAAARRALRTRHVVHVRVQLEVITAAGAARATIVAPVR